MHPDIEPDVDLAPYSNLPAASDAQIKAAASRLVADLLFPDGSGDSPDVLTMARSDKYQAMLVEEMRELAWNGVDPTKLAVHVILPGVRMCDVELTPEDWDAYA